MRCEEVAGLSVAVKHCWFSCIKNHGHKEEMQWPTFYIRQAQQQTVRSHDGLRALLGHTAHAAKTGHCHSPILMVLACRSWLHTYVHTYMHAYIRTYIHTCMHTYIPSFHTPSFFVTHHLSHTTLSHTIVVTSPPPLSFLPSPSRYICCSLLEESDMWGYPVL